MPKKSDAKIAVVALIAFAAWLFVGLSTATAFADAPGLILNEKNVTQRPPRFTPTQFLEL